MNVKERLKIYLKSINLSIKAFEDSLNVANGYVNSISKSIGVDKIELIIENYPNLDIEWLLIGKGDMLKSITPKEVEVKENENINYKELADARKEIIESQKIAIESQKIAIESQKNEIIAKDDKIYFLELDNIRLKQELANATRQDNNRVAG